MASLRSLGVHKPSALPFLIAEAILPEDATEGDYTWELYNDNNGEGSPDEELVTTEYHVVWSRGGVVRKVYNFEIEQERVIQAVLTWFPTEEPSTSNSGGGNGVNPNGNNASRSYLSQGTQPATDPNSTAQQPPRAVEGRSRALVVFLKSQAHVFFLSGATHVVNLPFEVDRVFPATRGLLLQRKIPRKEIAPPTPQFPAAPPNSFISTTQSFLSQSYSQTHHRYGSSSGQSRLPNPVKPATTNALFLEELLKGSATSNSEGLPRVFSFTDPLSELGLVVNAISGNERGRLLGVAGSGHRRLEPIDKAEEVIYVSARNEIQFDKKSNDKPLLFIVTANYETNAFTIWSASYLEPKHISSARRHHSTTTGHKLRRRSSYGPTAPGTGATTPAVRSSDRLRESFGPATRSKTVLPSLSASQNKERLSDQAVEDALASQLDPNNVDISKQPKESRRVSSLLSRAEPSSSFDKTAFQDLATHRASLGSFSASFGAGSRRGHSLGGLNDRNSLGGHPQIRGRASTPGSIASRMSLGGASIDETLEDIMDEDSFDTVEDFNELDEMFGGLSYDGGLDQEPMDGLRKELVMSKVAEIPVQRYLKTEFTDLNMARAETQVYPRVFTTAAPFNSAILHERRLFLYIVHSSLRAPLECEFAVTRKRLPTPNSGPNMNGTNADRYTCVATFLKTLELKNTVDALKIVDNQVERVLCLNTIETGDRFLSVIAGWGTHLPTRYNIGPLKLFDPYAVFRDNLTRKTAGLKRTITPRNPLRRLLSPGSSGTFDILDGESLRHCLQMCLAPQDTFVSQIFDALMLILPNHMGNFILGIWWNIRRIFAKELEQSSNPEWAALLATLFSMAVPFVEEKPVSGVKSTTTSHRRSGGRPSSQQTLLESQNEDDRSSWRLMFNWEMSRPNTKNWQSLPWAWVHTSKPPTSAMSPPSRRSSHLSSLTMWEQLKGKKNTVPYCAKLARLFIQTPIGIAANDQWKHLSVGEAQDLRTSFLPQILVMLHLMREEYKLNILSEDSSSGNLSNLTPLLAQLGHWLRWESWDWKRGTYYDLDGGSAEDWNYEDSYMNPTGFSQPWESPPSILEWLSTTFRSWSYSSFPTLVLFIREPTASPRSPFNVEDLISTITPRTIALMGFFRYIHDAQSSPRRTVERISQSGINSDMLATFPEAAQAPLMEAIIRCQANPPTTWSQSLLKLVQREDLDLSLDSEKGTAHDVQHSQLSSMMGLQSSMHLVIASRDVHAICQGPERHDIMQSSTEVERYYISRLIFQEDRRQLEAYSLLEPFRQAVATYRPDGISEESAILDAQKSLMQWVMIRTFSLTIGNSMIKFSSKRPLLTEKYSLLGFSTSCLMKPMGNVVTAERANYSEEKYFWAFFNAGVAAGLSVARDAQGIDTSWIMYNKPSELTNRHAGLLLGLGLNGHLKTIAKWLSFKYLTPKHTMTSVGLLLGLSASYMGTMDTLVTRLLSVHVTRMLPPGAAELNLSPYTQTTGLMGIGLLYYNTQHRRMSEIMLSEIEHVDRPDPSEPLDTLRDEAYRLAAGFALGFINLGKGKDLRGLHDMRIVQRLMGVAVAPKAVDIVHILDQATAGAVIAVALIFMKTHDEAVARKIDIPDTLPQFDYVRPDIFLLRTLAKHLIMWDNIRANHPWIQKNLPAEYRKDFDLRNTTKLRSEQMPFFNILAGLLWSVSLKYAGTGDLRVKGFLVQYLDQFMRICKLPAIRYDAKLARNTVRNCQDLLALCCATVMAGTGDLDVFRRLRALHGRVGPEYPYGSHLASHMAFGALFVGGGTYTFSTSNKAIAALICAFYPLYPMEVQDSKAHLQAFRHFWVLAAEPRCIIVRDVDTGRAIKMGLNVSFKDGTDKAFEAPCLLPELHTLSTITTTNIDYWPTTLDFVNNPLHLQTFERHQTLHVRRRSAHDMYASTFSATLVALNDAQSSRTARLIWDWLFTLPSLREFEKADVGLILPTDPYSGTFLETRGTVVDRRLVLRGMAGRSWRFSQLADLKGLFVWAESVVGTGDGRVRWLGREVLERLKAGVLERGRGGEGV
ncbi:hypothetical protein GQ43DRAFT_482173 [Delitschia confertaspora ATCC 74209]|uniref:Anaphase-promoting complex subunit 1 n=1 Tax=Delitschia confertaspora ATCC 74209 TaxID=1513339 RepID=A0A9P4MXB8_9PLEO|nr:hypothetical protein GQ43DRAFT_482173 [Delitschia confertaspora ATCC 74209]